MVPYGFKTWRRYWADRRYQYWHVRPYRRPDPRPLGRRPRRLRYGEGLFTKRGKIWVKSGGKWWWRWGHIPLYDLPMVHRD